MGSNSWTVSGGAMFVVLYMVGGYCMYSVASYHGILRRMNQHSREIISSVSQGGFQSGMNYQRLEEECWQSQPNIVSEFRETGPGLVRDELPAAGGGVLAVAAQHRLRVQGDGSGLCQ